MATLNNRVDLKLFHGLVPIVDEAWKLQRFPIWVFQGRVGRAGGFMENPI